MPARTEATEASFIITSSTTSEPEAEDCDTSLALASALSMPDSGSSA